MSKIKTLDELQGLTFKLGSWDSIDKKEHTLINHKKNIDKVILFTDKRTIAMYERKVSDFLEAIEIIDTVKKEFKPTKKNIPMATSEKINLSVYEPTEAQKETQNALSTMLKEVLENKKDAIPKAHAVVNIANAMINMEKSQVQMIKMVGKLN